MPRRLGRLPRWEGGKRKLPKKFIAREQKGCWGVGKGRTRGKGGGVGRIAGTVDLILPVKWKHHKAMGC